MLGILFAAAAMTAGQDPSCCDPMAVFAADPAFVAAHAAPLPLRFAPKTGKAVRFSVGPGPVANGFYVSPKKGVTAEVVMVHEWWGLNDYIKREAERLAEKTGYGVLAVDLYDGKVAATPQDAGRYMQAVDPARARAIVHGAVNALEVGSWGPKSQKIGTIGWCFGGGWSLQAAIEGGSAVKACVMYYGMPEQDDDRLKALRAPVILVWAKRDNWINADVVTKFEKAMATLHKPLTVYPYDADHGFANPSNPHYDKAATEDAMSKTLAFLKGRLS